jgi:hypothetical protein
MSSFCPGSPTQTGVGTLIVNLMDINDNFPTFAQDYRPVIYENEPPGRTVAIISAIDKDTATNGPPFEMWLPCGGGCPCPDNPVCGLFDFKFEAGMLCFSSCSPVCVVCVSVVSMIDYWLSN